MKQEANQLLFNEDSPEEVIQKIAQIKDSSVLYYFVWHYNWDNGLEIPQAVLDNQYCDLSIALLIFFRADGLSFLLKEDIDLPHWYKFINSLFEKLNSGYYKKTLYEFSPELTKIQAFKIRKNSPDLPQFYFEGTRGEQLDLTI